MAAIEERVSKLEANVARLETWAGPGQIDALIEGQRDLRTQMGDLRTQVRDIQGQVRDFRGQLAKVQQVQDAHTGMIAGLKTDVAALKTDMAWVRDTLREVLRRLPPPPPD